VVPDENFGYTKEISMGRAQNRLLWEIRREEVFEEKEGVV